MSEISSSVSKSEMQAFGLGILAILLWSTVATGFKLGLQTMQPAQLLLAGCIASFVLFSFFLVRANRQGLNRRNVAIAACLGLLNPLAYYLILFEAYDRLPAQIAQPLNYTWAITVAILAVPILKQKLSARTLVGIVISYLGVVILVTRGSFTSWLQFDLTGIVLALGSTVLWALYWLYSAKQQINSFWFMWIGFATAIPLLFIYCVLTDGLPSLAAPTLIYGLWVGLVEMGFAFLLWHRAMVTTRHTAALSQLIYISPFISLLLINLVLEETLHQSVFYALILIFVGVGAVNISKGRVDAIRSSILKR